MLIQKWPPAPGGLQRDAPRIDHQRIDEPALRQLRAIRDEHFFFEHVVRLLRGHPHAEVCEDHEAGGEDWQNQVTAVLSHP